jgi:hypothetical protein
MIVFAIGSFITGIVSWNPDFWPGSAGTGIGQHGARFAKR